MIFRTFVAVALFSATLVSANAASLKRFVDPCEGGKAAFEKTVYAKIKTDCAECHAPGGRGPTFVLADTAAAYMRVKNYVDFVDLSRSVLGIRAGNNHCLKENCNEASGKEMKTLLQAWWDGGESSCKTVGKYFTAAITAPSDLPVYLPEKVDAWKRIEWDLSAIRDDLAGTKFSVEAQVYSPGTDAAPAAYRFRKPRMHQGFDPIRIAGVRILVNGKFDRLANAYESIDTVTAPQEVAGGGILEFPVLTSQPLLLLQEKKAGDMFSVAFDELTIVDRPKCKEAGMFKEKVLPILAKADCASCHTTAGTATLPAARASFAMELTDDQLCSAFIQRTNHTSPLRSVVIEMPARGKLGHPIVITEPAAYLDVLQTWMSAEGYLFSKDVTN